MADGEYTHRIQLGTKIWLWDFGGQADQRLIHQLYVDKTALILLVFNADKDVVVPGLREWQQALSRCVPGKTRTYLVAGRIDVGFRFDREKVRAFAREHDYEYFETSSYDGRGCLELRRAIQEGIPWAQLERRTSPATHSDGRGSGKRMYLQLKAGNSYLERRKGDGAEIFRIKEQRWVEYWLKQDCPVLLVIGTFPKEEELRGGKEERFADIRWMEIGELLRRASNGGKKPVKQIVFEGERLDVMSVRRWRDKVLGRG